MITVYYYLGIVVVWIQHAGGVITMRWLSDVVLAV